jgi:SAM-dependent methyltransferase
MTQIPSQSQEGYGYDDPSGHPAIQAARVVVRLLQERLKFTSVLDVGCGVGLWLREFVAVGVTDIQGVDGAWVPRERLAIPHQAFRAHDLSQPVRFGREFDLVLSLEVAEHIPAEASDRFLDTLVAHGPTVVFSAAIPGQGGFQHVNEQVQDYWIERFRARGYVAYDVIRPLIWNDPAVPYYYAQNMLVFSRTPLPFPTEFIPTPIHPELFRRRSDPKNYSLRAILRHLPSYVRRLRQTVKRPGPDSQ